MFLLFLWYVIGLNDMIKLPRWWNKNILCLIFVWNRRRLDNVTSQKKKKNTLHSESKVADFFCSAVSVVHRDFLPIASNFCNLSRRKKTESKILLYCSLLYFILLTTFYSSGLFCKASTEHQKSIFLRLPKMAAIGKNQQHS